jgi:coenzyme F420-0:L-glutamate ligase/coenzyme F420-1:gamma-L-glutamate ligase
MLVLSPDDRAFLHRARVGHLAATSSDGEPQVVPVCFVFDGTCLYSAIDAKLKRVAAQKLRRLQNIRAKPRASLVVDRYDEDWTRLRYVLAFGRAEILDAGPDHDLALDLLREKYPQYRTMRDFGLGPVIRLTPERVRTWRGSPHPA